MSSQDLLGLNKVSSVFHRCKHCSRKLKDSARAAEDNCQYDCFSSTGGLCPERYPEKSSMSVSGALWHPQQDTEFSCSTQEAQNLHCN